MVKRDIERLRAEAIRRGLWLRVIGSAWGQAIGAAILLDGLPVVVDLTPNHTHPAARYREHDALVAAGLQ